MLEATVIKKALSIDVLLVSILFAPTAGSLIPKYLSDNSVPSSFIDFISAFGDVILPVLDVILNLSVIDISEVDIISVFAISSEFNFLVVISLILEIVFVPSEDFDIWIPFISIVLPLFDGSIAFEYILSAVNEFEEFTDTFDENVTGILAYADFIFLRLMFSFTVILFAFKLPVLGLIVTVFFLYIEY